MLSCEVTCDYNATYLRKTIIAPLAPTAVGLTFFIIMKQTGLVTKYLTAMKTGNATIFSALDYVQELIHLKPILSEERLKKKRQSSSHREWP